MTSDEFYRKFKGVNGPSCRGAKMPPFRPNKVNEAKFADELRFKEYGVDFREGDDKNGDLLLVRWVSQDWDKEGVLELAAEIERCMKHIGFIGTVWLEAHMRGAHSKSRLYSASIKMEIKKGEQQWLT